MHTASDFICDHQLSSIRDLNIYQSDVLWQIFVDTSMKWVHILKEHMAILFYPLCNICSQREHEQSWLKMHNALDRNYVRLLPISNEKESDDVVFVIISSSENYIKQHQRSEYYDECEYFATQGLSKWTHKTYTPRNFILCVFLQPRLGNVD